MEKMMLMRSLARSILRRSQVISSSAAATSAAVNHNIRHLHFSFPSVPSSSPNQHFQHPYARQLGGIRSFSDDISHFPVIEDPQINRAFKDLIATSWDNLPPAIVHDVKKALSKSTEDKAAQRLFFNSVSSLKPFSSSASNVLKPGDVLKQSRIFSKSEITEYSKLSHDYNPLHFDSECASNAGFANTPIPGLLVASLFPRIIASYFPGAIYVKQTLEFRTPVFIGDMIIGEVQANNIRQLKDKFMVKFATSCIKDGGTVVIGGEATAILPRLAVKEVDSR